MHFAAMKIPSLLVSLIVSPTFAGTLPQLNEDPWTGWYMGMQSRDFRLGVNIEGEIFVIGMKNRKDPVTRAYQLVVSPVVEELTGNGRKVSKAVQPDGWEAVTPASNEPDKIVYRGTVTGGARFEVVIEPTKEGFIAGGRVIDAGTLNDPLRFSFRCRMPDTYKYKKNEEELEKEASRDGFEFVHVDGKKVKLDGMSKVDAESPEVMGDGLKSASIEFGVIDAEVEISNLGGGRLELWNEGERELYSGLSVNWAHDSAKDPEGKGRFELKWK